MHRDDDRPRRLRRRIIMVGAFAAALVLMPVVQRARQVVRLSNAVRDDWATARKTDSTPAAKGRENSEQEQAAAKDTKAMKEQGEGMSEKAKQPSSWNGEKDFGEAKKSRKEHPAAAKEEKKVQNDKSNAATVKANTKSKANKTVAEANKTRKESTKDWHPRLIKVDLKAGATVWGVGNSDEKRKKNRSVPLIRSEKLTATEHNVTALDETERKIPPPKISPGCTAPIHAQPICNSVHELDIHSSLLNDLFRKISKGAVRNVWSVLETYLGANPRRIRAKWEKKKVAYAIKTLRWTREFTKQTYELQQREAVALDYLSHSPNVVEMQGFCATTSISNYAEGGDLSAFLKHRLRDSNSVSPAEFLAVAARLARGVASMQEKDVIMRGRGYESEMALQVVHRDVGASNVLLSQGKNYLDVRLDDFNKAYVLRRYDKDSSSNETVCTYQDRFICGEDGRRPDTRSPEECKGKKDLTSQIDTYGLGTVLFYLLTQHRAHNLNADAPGPAEENIEWYRDRVRKGEAPELPKSIETISNKAVQAIMKGMRMSMTPDPRKRPTAKYIADYLEEQYDSYVADAMKSEEMREALMRQQKKSNTTK